MKIGAACCLLSLLTVACIRVDDDQVNLSETPVNFAQIEVTVLACNPATDPFCEDTQAITGAKILVFETEEDRQFDATPLFEGITGGTGKYTFTQLAGGTRFYLRTTCPNEIRETSESTPGNGIAYHEILCTE